MPAPEKVAIVIAEWIARAENDLKTAALALRAGKNCPTDTVCFHAQQVVEKYLKGCLRSTQPPFPRLTTSGSCSSAFRPVRLSLTEDEKDELTDYATAARYPGWGDIPLSEARRPVAIARRVRGEIRKLLPRQALRLAKP